MYPFFLTLYVQYTKNTAVKKWLSFEHICAVYIQYIETCNSVRCNLFVGLICAVPQDPSRQKVASIWTYMCSILRIHSNLSLCPIIPNYIDLICSVHQETSHQKVESMTLYMHVWALPFQSHVMSKCGFFWWNVKDNKAIWWFWPFFF